MLPETTRKLKIIYKKKSAFTVKKTADGITVEHTHNSSDNDMVYLISSHIDQYWRTRKVEWFRAMLPIGYTQPIKNILEISTSLRT
jgi:hypothetical protein